MEKIIWKCIPPSPSLPSSSPLHTNGSTPRWTLIFSLCGVSQQRQRKVNLPSPLLKHLSEMKILSIRSVYCLVSFTDVAGGLLEGDFEKHLRASWQITSANRKSAGWLLFTSNFQCEARFPPGLSTQLFLLLKLNKCPGFQRHGASQCSHLKQVENASFRRRIQNHR